jgi:sugar phosphate isomerase/epimerase
MLPAISTISLPAFNHERELDALPDFGFRGVEVAPSRVWRDTWHGLTAHDVVCYRRRIEATGLVIVGLHSLLFDHPELSLFGDTRARVDLADFFDHLSVVCRDLGGRTLIWGSGRRRHTIPVKQAFRETVDFFSNLCHRIENHGTCFCLEPLGPKDSDFVNSALESLAIVEAVGHPALKIQLDAKALVENGEATVETFKAVRAHLIHFHANEPGLGVLGSSGTIDHAAMGRMLHTIGYDGYVTAEQRVVNATEPLTAIAQSAGVLRACYT